MLHAGTGDDEEGVVSSAQTSFMYVVEAKRPLKWSKTEKVGGLPTATLHAAMLKTSVRDGIPVLLSTGTQHTLSVLAYLFDELCKGGLDPQQAKDGAASTVRAHTLLDSPWNSPFRLLSQPALLFVVVLCVINFLSLSLSLSHLILCCFSSI